MNDNLQASRRQYRIDLLKAFAIIGVVLYHSGNLANGYLGVEVFLVIAGYFFTREYLKESISDHFNPFSFLNKRISASMAAYSCYMPAVFDDWVLYHASR